MFNIQCKLSEMLIDASNEWHFEIRKFSNFQSGCKHPEQTKTNKGEKLVQAKSLFKNYIAIQAFTRLFSGHGPQTGRCVLNDKPQRYGSAFVCQIQSWWVHYNSPTQWFKWFTQKSIQPSTSRCPVEDDRLVLGKTKPLITGSETHTVFIKVKMLDQTRPDWWTRCVFQNSILFVQF